MATSSFSVEVTGELANRVSDAVASGEYATCADVVRAALESWSEEREPEDVAHLKRCWDEAVASESVFVDIDELFDRLIAKHNLRLLPVEAK